MDTAGSLRQPRERDFLDELQRQRDEVVDSPSYARPPGDDEIAALVSAPRVERIGRRARAGQERRPPTTRTTWRSPASFAGSSRAGGEPTGPVDVDPRDVAAFERTRERVLARIADGLRVAGRDPGRRHLVAVSKTVAVDRLRAAVAAGLTALGENRVQEAADKVPDLPGATWHFIGPLQSNKARRAVELFDVIQSVDSVELGRAPGPHRRRGPARARRSRSSCKSTSTTTRPRRGSRERTCRPPSTRSRDARAWSCVD